MTTNMFTPKRILLTILVIYTVATVASGINIVKFIACSDEYIWVADDTIVVSIDKRNFAPYEFRIPQIRETQSKTVNKIRTLQNIKGQLWISTTYGICQLKEESIQQTIEQQYVHTLLADSNEIVWAGGVLPFTKFVNGIKDKQYDNPCSPTSSVFYMKFTQFDSQHTMWVAVRRGEYYDNEEKAFKACSLFTFTEENGFKPFPRQGEIYDEYTAMSIDSSDNIWLTLSQTPFGPFRYNQTDGFTFFTSENSNIPEDWKVQRVACLGNDVFVGADKGLLRYNGEGFDRYPFEETMTVQTMLVDDGNVYIGTKEHGLWRFRDGQFVRIPLDTDSHSAIHKPTIEMKKPLSYTIDGMPATSHTKGVKVDNGRKIMMNER